MMRKNEQINLVIDTLDVDRIQKVLNFLNINWVDSNTGEKRIPNNEDIVNIAKMCMSKAFESEDKFFTIGGFEAEVINGVVGIRYVLTQSNPLSSIFN